MLDRGINEDTVSCRPGRAGTGQPTISSHSVLARPRFTHIWGQLCGWPGSLPVDGRPRSVDNRCATRGQLGAAALRPPGAPAAHRSVPTRRPQPAAPLGQQGRRPSTPSTGPITTAVDLSSRKNYRSNNAGGWSARRALRVVTAEVGMTLAASEALRWAPRHRDSVPGRAGRPERPSSAPIVPSAREVPVHEVPRRTRRPRRRRRVGGPQPPGPAAGPGAGRRPDRGVGGPTATG